MTLLPEKTLHHITVTERSVTDDDHRVLLPSFLLAISVHSPLLFSRPLLHSFSLGREGPSCDPMSLTITRITTRTHIDITAFATTPPLTPTALTYRESEWRRRSQPTTQRKAPPASRSAPGPSGRPRHAAGTAWKRGRRGWTAGAPDPHAGPPCTHKWAPDPPPPRAP